MKKLFNLSLAAIVSICATSCSFDETLDENIHRNESVPETIISETVGENPPVETTPIQIAFFNRLEEWCIVSGVVYLEIDPTSNLYYFFENLYPEEAVKNTITEYPESIEVRLSLRNISFPEQQLNFTCKGNIDKEELYRYKRIIIEFHVGVENIEQGFGFVDIYTNIQPIEFDVKVEPFISGE